jgi:hypothetical protein
MLNSVVRITTAGDLQGSGSIVGVESETIRGRHWPYLVTADHVIRSQVLIELDVPDPQIHGELFKSVPVEGWRQPLPEVDLAVAPFPYDHVPRYQNFLLERFVPSEAVVPLGGQVLYLGIFEPAQVPMARGGNLGALDAPIDYTRFGVRYRYAADLLDCRSYKGFSGSPCVATLSYAVVDSVASDLPPNTVPANPDGSEPQLRNLATLASFCGILTQHYSDENSCDAHGAVSRYGVCVMLPCDYVRAAL